MKRHLLMPAHCGSQPTMAWNDAGRIYDVRRRPFYYAGNWELHLSRPGRPLFRMLEVESGAG